jgi:uncharacterized protein DUF4874/uncharacterized protein DUF4832
MCRRTRDLATAIAAALAVSTGCGGGDSLTQSAPTAPPTVILSAGASSGFVGQPVFLTWSSTNATSCTASGGWSGAQATSGSTSVTATAAGLQTYSLSCVGPKGSATASVAFTATTPAFSLTNSFSPNGLTIPTSEGAPYGLGDLWLGKTTLQTRLGYGPTRLQALNICLSAQVGFNDCSKAPLVTGPLSAQMLAGIDAGIAAYAGTGARLRINFIYKWSDGFPNATVPGPPLNLILTHLDQLAPILLKQRDLIFDLDAGFIGSFGQWVGETNGLDTSVVAHKQLLDKELSYFKGVFPILLPWLGDYVKYAGGRVVVDGLGVHDDSFDSGVGSVQPFFNRDFPFDLSIDSAQAFASRVSATSVFTGEFNGSTYPTQSCATLDAVAYQFHVQAFGVNPENQTTYPTLETNGCGTAFLNKVGTRIELQSATVLGDPTIGHSMIVALTMVNAGYGRVVRARPASLVFISNGSIVAEVPIALNDLDLRQAASRAGPKAFQFTVAVPSNIPSGNSITIAIRIPDPAPSLTPQAAYALPLNSVDSNGRAIFDPATGLNTIASFKFP